jgi:RsiW-degrading membrane proteinase PrsW (M82 family)
VEETVAPLSLGLLLGIGAGALVIALSLLLFLRGRHPFHRVPFWRVIVFFLYGTLVAPVAVLVTLFVLGDRSLDAGSAIGAFLIIGPVEEAAKFAGPLLLVGLVRRWREEPFEWMLAGAAAGTGFAMTENILYALASPEAFQLLMMRSLAPMHLLWSGWLGYRIGRRKRGTGGFVRAALAGFLIAAFLHGLWDALCFTGMVGLLVALFGGQILAFGWHVRKMTWLCANRSPRRPDPAADLSKAPGEPSPDFRCAPCGSAYRKVALRGAELLSCAGCGRAAMGRGDLFRLVSEYSGSSGWFALDRWYAYYWREPEAAEPLPCPGCGGPAPARRFLRDDGPRIGFCGDCALAVGDRKEVLGLVDLFRVRLEDGFLNG